MSWKQDVQSKAAIVFSRFHRWPLDALVAVSEVYLNRFEILVKSNTIKRSVVELMADIHDDVSRICENYYEKFRRRTYVTPKSFLSYDHFGENID